MPYASNGDVNIYYEVHGSSGPGLVFAHGAGGNATSWWQQVPEFTGSFRVIVFDHRGFARSHCAPEAQSAAHFEADLMAVMDDADVPDAAIVCQSMGGWTGVRAAVNRTDRVRAVLLGNTPGAVRNAATEANMASLQEQVGKAGLVNVAISREFAERSPAGALLYNQISAYNTDARPNIRDSAIYVEPSAVRDCGVPFLVLSSDLDPLFPPDVLESVAEDIGAPCVRINGAGHSTYFEKPEAFNAVVAEFLRTNG